MKRGKNLSLRNTTKTSNSLEWRCEVVCLIGPRLARTSTYMVKKRTMKRMMSILTFAPNVDLAKRMRRCEHKWMNDCMS